MRRGEQRAIAANYEHHLRNEHGRWRIAEKKICLVNRDTPPYNLNFLL